MRIQNRTLLLIIMYALALSGCKKDAVTEPRFLPQVVETEIGTVLRPVTYAVTQGVNGYYMGLPSNYEQTQSAYPLLVFIPGAGQFGNGSLDLPLLLKDGPAELYDEKRFPGKFKVDGKQFSFIVFTPQLEKWMSPQTIVDCIAYVKRKYRIDSTRIYLSGLSAGAILACDVSAASSQIAAVVPIAGIPLEYKTNNICGNIAARNLPLWAFHSQDDPQFDVNWVKDFIATINAFKPALPSRLTVWANGGHDAWTRAIEPGYKEDGKNIYEWMLQFHK